jgi:hypothetical protein
MRDPVFVRRTDRSGESICLTCFLTIHARNGVTLRKAQDEHNCRSSALVALMRARHSIQSPKL